MESNNLIFIKIFFFIIISHVCSEQRNIESNTSVLKPLHEKDGKSYYISAAAMNSTAARRTCESMSKDVSQKLRLLIIDDEKEYNILKSKLANMTDMKGIWTAGIIQEEPGVKYAWAPDNVASSSKRIAMMYTNFANVIRNSPKRKLKRSLRRFPEVEEKCSDTGYPPGCEAPKCAVRFPECKTITPPCEITTPPVCTTVRPDCKASKPKCKIETPPCQVEQDPCIVENDPCPIVKPDCHIYTPDCITIKPNCTTVHPECQVKTPPPCTTTTKKPCMTTEKPCDTIYPPCKDVRPPNCEKPKCRMTKEPCYTSKRRCKPGRYGKEPKCEPGALVCPEVEVCDPEPDYCKPKKVCPPPVTKCKPSWECKPQPYVCQSPAIICPQPQTHCTPAHTECDPPEVICEDVKPDCPKPRVICPPPRAKCPPPVIKCSAPEVTCPAATTCKPAQKYCDPPTVMCPDPVIECTPSKYCEVLPPCSPNVKPSYSFNSVVNETLVALLKDNKNEIDPTLETVELPFKAVTQNVQEDRCISIKTVLDFKWDIESCSKKYNFICESA